MRFGVIVFPGSNCDYDCYNVIKRVFRQPVEFIWHDSKKLDGVDCIILPGGFSYGDYLRAGAIARFSHIMDSIIKFADKGGLVIGICNGFQILTEAGLLPGALQRNKDLKFICRKVHLRCENSNTPFTTKIKKGRSLMIPIAHGEGNYTADPADEANPNGSMLNIAGICNKKRNVLGMMPHPERCSEAILGGTDGKLIFESVLGKD
jgi:phosphoribosylformylglycinamidine synthase I